MNSNFTINKYPKGFPLWNLLSWYSLGVYLNIKVLKKIERELLQSAKEFISYPLTGGLSCFKTPYGTYIWHYCVSMLHYQLTNSPEFVEGFNYCKGIQEEFNEKWQGRDGNPYSQKDDFFKNYAWDCGYIMGLHFYYKINNHKFVPISIASQTLSCYDLL